MLRTLIFCIAIIHSCNITFAQKTIHLKDSVSVSLYPLYDSVSKNHRLLFGENYRKEWAAQTKLPVIRISEIEGGLTPTELGGGHQSHSLRLEEKSGKEWVLRSIRKYSEGLAPDLIRGSMYEEWIDDNFSAQHPYSALIVPVLADAVKVPHTNPVIGVVAPDSAMGKFAEEFVGTICLLEEREPEGDSDNTIKMLSKLDEDNDNRLDTAVFFRARLLDLLIGDWGRHEDQWRWVDTNTGEGKNYLVVPRDRDQVFYINEGVLPRFAANLSMLSFLEGFNNNYKDPNAFFINGRKLNQQFLNQYTYPEWMTMTREFVAALPDDILKRAVKSLPESSYSLKGDQLYEKLKSRRDNMIMAMDSYYRFLYKIVDIRTSDKAELAEFSEAGNGALDLSIYKLGKSGDKKQMLYSNTFQPDITREIRLFAGKGKDKFVINVPSEDIKIRIVGEGEKKYEVLAAKNKVNIYGNTDSSSLQDPGKRLVKHFSSDTLNTKKLFSNLYLGSGLSPAIDLRSLDGLLPGLSYKIEKEGFRKEPYGMMQKITALHSLSTRSFIIEYNAEWKGVFKNTDITVDGLADMKGNILNFFGRGNDTYFDQTGNYRRFYKVNFSLYKVDPAFHFSLPNNITITAGPSFQYYSAGNNKDRYFMDPGVVNSFNNLFSDKAHGGAVINFSLDKRDDSLLPTKGLHFNLQIAGYEGLNKTSSAFAQAYPQFSFYKSLDKKANIVIAERIGAGFTTGETTFYQSAFLGSQDNLLGFRKYRFAGDRLLYNNLEARINLPNVLHYVLPGRVGLIGFYDAGRVWIKDEVSDTIHHGFGGGIYLTPFNRLFIRAVAGFSKEGMQPTVSLRQRF